MKFTIMLFKKTYLVIFCIIFTLSCRKTGTENPIPDSSNFCDPFEGRVRPYLNETLYHGNYTIIPVTAPQDLQSLHDSLGLLLETTITDPKGGGYGNGGGIIHYLDCRSLVLIQVDPEGFGQHLFKIYKSNISEGWFEF